MILILTFPISIPFFYLGIRKNITDVMPISKIDFWIFMLIAHFLLYFLASEIVSSTTNQISGSQLINLLLSYLAMWNILRYGICQ